MSKQPETQKPRSQSKGLAPRLASLSAVKIFGLGGVGGIAARYLVMFLAALAHPVRVVLIDGDDFEARNAERMFFSRFGNKAAVVRDDLLDLLGDSLVTLTAVEEYACPDNLGRLLHDGDIALLAVDNHATRKLVSDFCEKQLHEVCLISGGNDAVGEDSSGHPLRGTYGNVQILRRCRGATESPALTLFHPEIRTPRDQLPSELSCSQALLSVPQILFTNLATASAMLNAFFLHLCGALHYPEACFDIAEGLMRPVFLPCRLPGSNRS